MCIQVIHNICIALTSTFCIAFAGSGGGVRPAERGLGTGATPNFSLSPLFTPFLDEWSAKPTKLTTIFMFHQNGVMQVNEKEEICIVLEENLVCPKAL